MGWTAYAVYADHIVPSLHFIVLERAGERPLSTLVYRLGWKLPRSLAPHVANLCIGMAPHALVQAAQTAARELLAAFLGRR